MQLLAMPLLAELGAISAASPNAGATTAAAQGGSGDSQSGAAAPFGQLLAQLQGEGGKSLPPAELAAALGISVEQLQQALAQLRQALAITAVSKLAPTASCRRWLRMAVSKRARPSAKMARPFCSGWLNSSRGWPAKWTRRC